MPFMPGYSHYFLSRHLAQENLRERLRRQNKIVARHEIGTHPSHTGLPSSALITLVMVCLIAAGTAIVALAYP